MSDARTELERASRDYHERRAERDQCELAFENAKRKERAAWDHLQDLTRKSLCQ